MAAREAAGAQPRSPLARAVRGLAFVLFALPVAAAALFVSKERDSTIELGFDQLRVVNELASGQIVRSLDAIDSVLRNTAEILRDWSAAERADPVRLHATLRVTSAGLPQIRRLYLVDADDVVAGTSTRSDPVRGYLGDRSYVSGLGEGGVSEPVISPPFSALDNEEPLIHVARRLTDRTGRHLGILAVAVRPAYFAGIYAAGSRVDAFTGRLFLDDVVLIAAHPAIADRLGQRFDQNPILRAVLATPFTRESLRLVSSVDGEDRLVDLLRLPGAPLMSAVSLRAQDVLADWQFRAITVTAAAFTLACLLLATLLWLARELDRQELARRAAARAQEAERQMAIAQAASAEKSRVLAAASHDLRQPLHAIGLFAAALTRRASDGENVVLARQIERACRSMSRMFDALLDVARLEAGAMKPSFGAVALAPLLSQLRDELAAELADRPIALRMVATTAIVRSDAALLETMLRNLLANAARYTRKGRILIGCRHRALADRPARAVEIQVWDTGIGIGADDRARIFDRFTRAAASSSDGKSIGLGLSVVRDIGIALDHRVGLRSWEGRGSCFSVTVPVDGGAGDDENRSVPDRAGVLVLADPSRPGRDWADALDRVAFDVVACADPRSLEHALRDENRVVVVDWSDGGLARDCDDDALVLIAGLERALARPVEAVIVADAASSGIHERLRRSGRVWLTRPCSADQLRGAVLLGASRCRARGIGEIDPARERHH